MYYIIIFIICLIIIIININYLEHNQSDILVPYTINSELVDFIHYGYFKSENDSIIESQLNLIYILIKNIEINKNDTILDVGCGVGGFIKYLNENYSNINIIGVDINKIHINYSKNKNKSIINNNTIKHYISDIINFIPDNKFDKIFAIECGFHFNKNKFLNNAYNYLNKNGQIIIADIVTTPKIKDLLYKKNNINNIILQSFGTFDNFWESFNYVLSMEKIGYKNIEYQDITHETYGSYSFLEKYAYKNTINGILLLKDLHSNGYLKYIIIKATK
jgi:SAM-dependent methyltransferase